MKKFFYIILFAIATSLTVTSCTEEEVVPSTENGGTSNGTDRNF
jgi:hypothetical protein